jgi:hypothetical protein
VKPCAELVLLGNAASEGMERLEVMVAVGKAIASKDGHCLRPSDSRSSGASRQSGSQKPSGTFRSNEDVDHGWVPHSDGKLMALLTRVWVVSAQDLASGATRWFSTAGTRRPLHEGAPHASDVRNSAKMW